MSVFRCLAFIEDTIVDSIKKWYQMVIMKDVQNKVSESFRHFLDTLIKEFLEDKKKALQINDLQGFLLVETAGIEPASADPLPLALHV